MKYGPAHVPVGQWLSRREFLRTSATLCLSAASLTLLDACSASSTEPSTSQETLETTSIRIADGPGICFAPAHLMIDMLKDEGFTSIQQVPIEPGKGEAALSGGRADFGMLSAGEIIGGVDADHPIIALAGVQVGCFELFGANQVNKIGDMKGKTVAVPVSGGSQQIFLSGMLSYVGIDPKNDINWVIHTFDEAKAMLSAGTIDAYLAFAPEPQELRAKKIGRVIVNTNVDKPWSQYFCCMAGGNSDFIKKYPVASKRALRATLKMADMCASNPEEIARDLVAKGYTTNYDYVVEALRDIPFGKWREYDPADTLRFYTLRFREVGLVKSSPNDIIAKGTDWRILNALKQEMKVSSGS